MGCRHRLERGVSKETKRRVDEEENTQFQQRAHRDATVFEQGQAAAGHKLQRVHHIDQGHEAYVRLQRDQLLLEQYPGLLDRALGPAEQLYSGNPQREQDLHLQCRNTAQVHCQHREARLYPRGGHPHGHLLLPQQ